MEIKSRSASPSSPSRSKSSSPVKVKGSSTSARSTPTKSASSPTRAPSSPAAAAQSPQPVSKTDKASVSREASHPAAENEGAGALIRGMHNNFSATSAAASQPGDIKALPSEPLKPNTPQDQVDRAIAEYRRNNPDWQKTPLEKVQRDAVRTAEGIRDRTSGDAKFKLKAKVGSRSGGVDLQYNTREGANTTHKTDEVGGKVLGVGFKREKGVDKGGPYSKWNVGLGVAELESKFQNGKTQRDLKFKLPLPSFSLHAGPLGGVEVGPEVGTRTRLP